jgi:hypothetical protein
VGRAARASPRDPADPARRHHAHSRERAHGHLSRAGAGAPGTGGPSRQGQAPHPAVGWPDRGGGLRRTDASAHRGTRDRLVRGAGRGGGRHAAQQPGHLGRRTQLRRAGRARGAGDFRERGQERGP